MYTGQQVNVLWNGFHSDSFSVSNGVKQGAIISPISFCAYLDTLLIELRRAGVSCFIGDWFVAALAYAGDVVLLAPTARAMRTMLDICIGQSSDEPITNEATNSSPPQFY